MLIQKDLLLIRGIVEEVVDRKLEEFEAKMDAKFVALEARMEERFDRVEHRLDKIGIRLDNLEQRLEIIEREVTSNMRLVIDVSNGHEERIQELEADKVRN